MKTKSPKAAKLTPAQKRVLIAKDVLAQLRAKTLKAERGTYVDMIPKKEGDVFESSDVGRVGLREVLKTRIRRCHVCAVGSIFVAHTLRFNKIPVTSEMYQYNSIELSAENCRYFNNPTPFPGKMLLAMEDKFEDWNGTKSAASTLREIMKNVIDNDGDFVP